MLPSSASANRLDAVFGVAELEASGLIDRYCHGSGCGIAAIAGMQHERFRMLAVGWHFALLLVTLTKSSTATVSRQRRANPADAPTAVPASPFMARTGPPKMSAIRSLSGVKRKSRLSAGRTAFDPGCVKTRLRIPKPLSTNSD